MVKIKPKNFCFEVFISKIFFFFLEFNSIFNIFFLLCYVYICLFSLVLISLYVLKHVRFL